MSQAIQLAFNSTFNIKTPVSVDSYASTINAKHLRDNIIEFLYQDEHLKYTTHHINPNDMQRSKKIWFWLPYAISILCAILFIYAATSKLWDFQQFKVELGQSPVLTAYAEWVAWSVPLTEYALSVLLLIDTTRQKALFGFLGLMTMFTTYIVIVLNFSDYVPCSCGGVLENMGWTEHLVFNLFFVALAIIAILQLESRSVNKSNLS